MPQTLLNLPIERMRQLRELQALRGHNNVSETLSELVRFFVDRHAIPHSVPGVTVHTTTDGLVFGIEGVGRVGLTHVEALRMAAAIRDFVALTRRGGMVDTSGKFAVARKGLGLKVGLPVTREDGTTTLPTRAFALDVALEIAGLLEEAVKAPVARAAAA